MIKELFKETIGVFAHYPNTTTPVAVSNNTNPVVAGDTTKTTLAATPSSNIKGITMNAVQIIVAMWPTINAAIQIAEDVATTFATKGAALTGVQKLQLAMSIIQKDFEANFPNNQFTAIEQMLTAFINQVVSIYNITQLFKKPVVAPTQPVVTQS